MPRQNGKTYLTSGDQQQTNGVDGCKNRGNLANRQVRDACKGTWCLTRWSGAHNEISVSGEQDRVDSTRVLGLAPFHLQLSAASEQCQISVKEKSIPPRGPSRLAVNWKPKALCQNSSYSWYYRGLGRDLTSSDRREGEQPTYRGFCNEKEWMLDRKSSNWSRMSCQLIDSMFVDILIDGFGKTSSLRRQPRRKNEPTRDRLRLDAILIVHIRKHTLEEIEFVIGERKALFVALVILLKDTSDGRSQNGGRTLIRKRYQPVLQSIQDDKIETSLIKSDTNGFLSFPSLSEGELERALDGIMGDQIELGLKCVFPKYRKKSGRGEVGSADRGAPIHTERTDSATNNVAGFLRDLRNNEKITPEQRFPQKRRRGVESTKRHRLISDLFAQSVLDISRVSMGTKGRFLLSK
ncbi:hypothetical protein J6590_027197 [Homalodisca vitripennis]|nr:hypothetical protein J6590_027197 [Homalodisca vitripennis]